MLFQTCITLYTVEHKISYFDMFFPHTMEVNMHHNFKISDCVLWRRRKIHWNDMRESKWWQNLVSHTDHIHNWIMGILCVSYRFKMEENFE